jgi:hypothetical protein
MENFISILISSFFGVAGIIVSLVFGIKLRKESKTIKMSELPRIANVCYKRCMDFSPHFIPDIILVPTAQCYPLASEIVKKFRNNIIILCGIRDDRENIDMEKFSDILKNSYTLINVGADSFKTILFPNFIFENKKYNILYLTDVQISGESMRIVKEAFFKQGFSKITFKTCSIATTERAINRDRSADIYYKIMKDDDVLYLPWGKAPK